MTSPTIKISPEVKAAILSAKRGENSLDFGPPGSMPGPLYKQVVKVLEQLGIIWNRGKKCHISATPISGILDAALSDGEVINHKKIEVQTYQFFPTVPDVARSMALFAWEAMDDPTRKLRLLEPEAGNGSLLLSAFETYPGPLENLEVVAVEVDPRHRHALEEVISKGDTVHIRDFLTEESLGEFDVILMNPPFSEGRDIKHIHKAVSLLKKGGVCIALCTDRPWNNGTKEAKGLIAEIHEICDMTMLEPSVIASTATSAISVMLQFIRKL